MLSSFDKLRMTTFDKLRMTMFDKLRMTMFYSAVQSNNARRSGLGKRAFVLIASR
jgi:hypothetical protein